jgi:Putative Actinobacterial Holin-X, holin superfamily III
MLKPAQPGPPPPDRPIVELLHQLVDDGKAYVEAEIALVKTIADAKTRVVIVSAILVGVAFLFALAGIAAFSLGVVLALTVYIGPLAAGFVGLLIFAAVAGALGWFGVERVRRNL